MQAVIGGLVGLVFGVGASAEPVLEGRVRLASEDAVASAQVQIFDMTDLQRGAVAQATTDGRGYFALPLAGLPGLALPTRFELGANYPNPFNPSTIIPYQLAALSHVRLEVFNLLGQRIATLVDGERSAGVHTALWDATDGSGQAVGAGVYLYRLTVGRESQTGRMVLVDGQAGVSAVGASSVSPSAFGGSGSTGEGVPVYGLVVSGSGIAPYVVADLGIQAGMAPMDLVVEAHPAGKVLSDDDSPFDLSDLFNTPSAATPDLVVSSASASDTTLSSGQAFTLQAKVRNQGDEPSSATTLRYYRSTDATIASDDEEVGTDAIGALNPSATSGVLISLTAPVSAGTYYYGACVESVRGESDTDNNCSEAVTITVSGTVVAEEDEAEEAQTDSTASPSGPDLVVSSASASPLTLSSGQAFTLHVTVQNQGTEPSSATVLRYYLSNNATITSGDEEVGTDAIGALNASATRAASIGLTAPTDGREMYFYGACVESVRGESDTDNNCSRAVTITVRSGDGEDGSTTLEEEVAGSAGADGSTAPEDRAVNVAQEVDVAIQWNFTDFDLSDKDNRDYWEKEVTDVFERNCPDASGDITFVKQNGLFVYQMSPSMYDCLSGLNTSVDWKDALREGIKTVIDDLVVMAVSAALIKLSFGAATPLVAPLAFAAIISAKSAIGDLDYALKYGPSLLEKNRSSTRIGLLGKFTNTGKMIPGPQYVPLLMVKNKKDEAKTLQLELGKTVDVEGATKLVTYKDLFSISVQPNSGYFIIPPEQFSIEVKDVNYGFDRSVTFGLEVDGASFYSREVSFDIAEGDYYLVQFTAVQSGDQLVLDAGSSVLPNHASAQYKWFYNNNTEFWQLSLGSGKQKKVPLSSFDELVDGKGIVEIQLDVTIGGETITRRQQVEITGQLPASTSISLSVSPHTVREDAGQTEITVTATLDGQALAQDVTVFFTIDGGSASRDRDYAIRLSPIVIPAGSISGWTSMLFNTLADGEDEGNETIVLRIGRVRGVEGLTGGSATITLTNTYTERPPPRTERPPQLPASTSISLSVSPHTVREDAGQTEITVTATLDGQALAQDATVLVTIDGGSASRDRDYAIRLSPIVIPAGSISGSASMLITTLADGEDEGDETIVLRIFGVEGLTGGSATITLTDP